MNRQFDKPKLLAMMRVEYEFALRTLELVPENRLAEPNVQGVWSVKDIYAHLSAWHRRALDWLASARRGEQPDRPQGNYTTEEIDAINEQIYQENLNRPADDIAAEFRQTFEQLYAETEKLSDGELFWREGIAVHFGHPAWRYIAYNACLHYPDHIEAVREWLRG